MYSICTKSGERPCERIDIRRNGLQFSFDTQNSLDVVPLKEEELFPAFLESAYGLE